ncbi:MAG TPA: ComF family protein [Thauera sp.]|nr:ComF family protein [Thauera sp.]HRA81532.1 ComF family protein [Thauera sp.]
MSNPVRASRLLFGRLLDALIPQDCLICGEKAAGNALCAACLAELPRRPPSACPICALPGLDGGPCGQCLRDPPEYDATRAVFDYAFPIDQLVQSLKYGYQLSIASFFARELLEAGEQLVLDADLIVPMPLHARRLAERGFNQAVEIARPLARACGLPMELARVRKLHDTPAQASLGRVERLLSPRGVFACELALEGQHVLVVDDVMTTGATLNELARCLKRQGARRVTNLVLARTPTSA